MFITSGLDKSGGVSKKKVAVAVHCLGVYVTNCVSVGVRFVVGGERSIDRLFVFVPLENILASVSLWWE
jgi:hypothetical protein